MIDYIIVGGGICGTFLSYYLLKNDQKIIVIDDANPNTSSAVASGVINPVTGRRLVTTWMIDELLPFAVNAYSEFEKDVKTNLIKQCNVLLYFATQQMKEAFESRTKEEPELLKLWKTTKAQEAFFRFNYGIGEINPCYEVDVQVLLHTWRRHLKEVSSLLEEKFKFDNCTIEKEKVVYKGHEAKKIIFCDGVAGARNPYFKMLPFAFNKGEALIVNIPHLPPTYIYKQGVSIVPWKEKGLFWIGSNYLWNYNDVEPTELFRKQTEEQLKYWLRLSFSVVDHLASERPANVERRPFVGLHPLYNSVGILNGMGTKGCSLAPYFAHQLTEHLLRGAPIEPLADVKRFTRVLSR